MKDHKAYFVKIIKELMEEDGISQLDLAAKIGMRQSQVHNWVAGKSMPGYFAIRQLANYFKVSADLILDTEYGD